jgi:malate synthase
MDEILYELRDHSAGLNAGRWDYIFSAIKCFADRPEMVLPDRGDVTMKVPFMHSYTELLAATCHRRGAHAIGGMAALIPSRRDEQANAAALEGVRADKQRELHQAYDGTWVAHPDLVPVAREVFQVGLDGAPNQLSRRRDDVAVSAAELLDLASTPGEVTETGLRTDISVGFQYISFWQLQDGRTVTRELVRELLDEETAKIRRQVGEKIWEEGHPARTRELFERVALSDELTEFLTLPAYQYLD